MSAYNYAVQVCAQVNVTLPSFNDIGQSSSGTRISVGMWLVAGVMAGTFVVVERWI